MNCGKLEDDIKAMLKVAIPGGIKIACVPQHNSCVFNVDFTICKLENPLPSIIFMGTIVYKENGPKLTLQS